MENWWNSGGFLGRHFNLNAIAQRRWFALWVATVKWGCVCCDCLQETIKYEPVDTFELAKSNICVDLGIENVFPPNSKVKNKLIQYVNCVKIIVILLTQWQIICEKHQSHQRLNPVGHTWISKVDSNVLLLVFPIWVCETQTVQQKEQSWMHTTSHDPHLNFNS